MDTYSFTTPAVEDIGTHTVSVTLDDGKMQTTYSFSVKVMTKPTFAFSGGATSFSDLTVALGSTKTFSIPTYSDADGD